MARRIIIIGGGIAGLSCALHAQRRGAEVILYEAAPDCGGRCRSYQDPHLGWTVDHGSHLILGANPVLLDLLRSTAAHAEPSAMLQPGLPQFAFFDAVTGKRWTLRPNAGPLPWWTASPSRRTPGLGMGDHLRLLSLAWAAPTASVADVCAAWPRAALIRQRLLDPLTKAIMNASAEDASARLLGATVLQTLGRGASACRPYFAPQGLSAALISPLTRALIAGGGQIHCGQRIRHITTDSSTGSSTNRAAPSLSNGHLQVAKTDAVVIALPPAALATLWPHLAIASQAIESRAITAVHYRLDGELPQPLPSLQGVINSPAEWIFCRQDFCRQDGQSALISLTLSAAPRPSPTLAMDLWPDARAALNLPTTAEPSATRVLHHRRATGLQSPSALEARDHLFALCAQSGLIVAGDWSESNLPNTLEAAARAGRRAAQQALTGVR